MIETPTKAYDLLDQNERDAVDNYVKHVQNEQKRKGQRIIHALKQFIPTEFVRRSQGALSKPLVRAALAEKIQELADEEDASPERVVREFISIALSNVADVVISSHFGEVRLKNMEDIPREVSAAIKSIKTIPTPHGIRTEVIMHEKQPALNKIAEMMGIVAADGTPVLKNYVKVPETDKEKGDVVPEKAYTELLEELSNA